MTSLIVNLILGFWLILFGAMALAPLLLTRSKTTARRSTVSEDRVVRIEHVAVIERRPATPSLASIDPITDHPSHRPAA